jgi:xylulokinase
MQIAADVLGAPIALLDNPHGSCVGAAWVAAMASGQNVAWSAVTRLSSRGTTIQPNPMNMPTYDRGYREYRALYEALKPIFRMRAA